jgi:hypothetical protein
MKTKFRIPVMLFTTVMLCTIAIVSCKDDPDPIPPPDLTALKASITAASDMLSSTEEGKNDGQYTADSRTALQDAITAAQGVVDNTETTQEQADAAKVSLDAAVTAYQGTVITPIAADALVAHWSFDEGTGATAGDASDNEFDGTFVAGPQWSEEHGGGMPDWVADRAGTAGKAIHFGEDGGSIEIPYNTKLNPESLSISLWLNADVIDANNRFLGLHSWIGYKFQLQEANRPFLTIGHATGAYDRDSEQNLPINEWHHVVATFGDGKMLFYVDGELIKTWEDTPNPAKSIADNPYNLVIGQDFPSDKYSLGDGTGFDVVGDPNYHVIPLAWGGHFKGSLDELRIYNVVLTESQVGSLYDREKP